MRRTAHLVLTCPLVFAALAACKSRPREEVTSSAKTTEPRGEFVEARDRVVRESQTKLDDLDVKLANLRRDAEARSATLTSDGKAAFADAIAKLEQQRATARHVLEEAKTSSAEQWQQVKQRADEALKKADDAYDAAVKKLRE